MDQMQLLVSHINLHLLVKLDIILDQMDIVQLVEIMLQPVLPQVHLLVSLDITYKELFVLHVDQ